MVNVALLSKWHVHAEDYAHQALQNEHLSIKLVWDEDEERGKSWAKTLAVPFEKDLQTVLSDPSVDAVIVDTPTYKHKEVIIAAARHKKHIFTEKVLALTVADCAEIYEEVTAANVELMISLPKLIEPYYLYTEDVLQNGWLGQVTMVRCRVAHNGAVPFEGHPKGWLPEHFFHHEECGGGALIDLGAHPIYLTNRLGGAVKAVTARLQNTLVDTVDDQAVVIVEYQSGALGTIETGFVSSDSPFQLEVYGTEGTLLIEDEKIRLKSRKLSKGNWVVPEQLPSALPMPMEQWVKAIVAKETPTITKEDAINLTKINEAAVLSHRQGRRVLLSEIKEGNDC